MKWIEVKMRELGVSSHTAYRLCFMIDSSAMISVHTPKYGVIDVSSCERIPSIELFGISRCVLLTLTTYRQWTVKQNTVRHITSSFPQFNTHHIYLYMYRQEQLSKCDLPTYRNLNTQIFRHKCVIQVYSIKKQLNWSVTVNLWLQHCMYLVWKKSVVVQVTCCLSHSYLTQEKTLFL